MPPTVFISHAGADSKLATSAADFLKRADINVRLDRMEIRTGASFIAFMDSALGMSDYCLLLWSRAARTSKFVAEEWHGALCRAIEEQRAFLTVGKLEDIPVPSLLKSRLWVELFPRLEPGMSRLVHEWRCDRSAAVSSGRPVGKTIDIEDPDGVRVYITSNLYGFTHPARLRLDQPSGILLDHILEALGLKTRIEDEQNRIGLQLEYRLRIQEHDLTRSESPMSVGAKENAVLQLMVDARIVAATAPESGDLGPARFLSVARGQSRLAALTDEQRRLVIDASNI